MHELTPRTPRSQRRVGVSVTLAVALFVSFFSVSMGTLLFPSPFAAAVEQASEIGNWEPEQVQFVSGAYYYRLFYLKAEADLRVNRAGSFQPVRIEMTKIPFFGWSVDLFDHRDNAYADLSSTFRPEP